LDNLGKKIFSVLSKLIIQMGTKVSIIIVTDAADSHWCETAHKINEALETASSSLRHRPDVRSIDVEELQSLAQFTDGTLCIICHLANLTAHDLSSLNLNALWLCVSGGDQPSRRFLPFESTLSNKIWFSGVYGRETQFKAWLIYWAERGFAIDAFAETHQALFSGKTGLGVTADRLRRNLLPLIMVLEAYQELVEDYRPLLTNLQLHLCLLPERIVGLPNPFRSSGKEKRSLRT
jgi:hypothetical protein